MGITIHPRPPDNYGKVLQQLSAYGNNLNQIAHVVNATGRVTAEQLDTALQIVEKTWDYVEDTLWYGLHQNQAGKASFAKMFGLYQQPPKDRKIRRRWAEPIAILHTEPR